MAFHPSFDVDINRYQLLAQLALLNKDPLEGIILQPRSTVPTKQASIEQDALSAEGEASSPLERRLDTFKLDGVVFPREGPYGRGCLKFVLTIQDKHTMLRFTTPIHHPSVDQDNCFNFPLHLVNATLRDKLAYMRASLIDVDTALKDAVNGNAAEQWTKDPVGFQMQVEECLRDADIQLYSSSHEDGFAMNFSRYSAAEHGANYQLLCKGTAAAPALLQLDQTQSAGMSFVDPGTQQGL
eukprot:TRINITY_DN11726_c0_g1_i4.p1 TRINITY_DN11726_c0_g1~~TRINITY_DN11726_c0_g1_i4.p1  ORF type:complete len:240 (+),score=22.32 TRINITY_DN11726_c0_g1_i4:33-752(+)